MTTRSIALQEILPTASLAVAAWEDFGWSIEYTHQAVQAINSDGTAYLICWKVPGRTFYGDEIAQALQNAIDQELI